MSSPRARVILLAVSAAVLAGCGTMPHAATAPTAKASSALAIRDDSDHAAMNKIIRDVLSTMYTSLLQTHDTDHDGAISMEEYAVGHIQDAAWLFQATFDQNRDRKITPAEYAAAMATDAPVEAYHHFTEEQMEKALDPYMADKNFNAQDLRSYMTHDLGGTGDWPLIFKLMEKLDTNKDGKLLSGAGEGSVFMLTFARQQAQHSLGLKLSPLAP